MKTISPRSLAEYEAILMHSIKTTGELIQEVNKTYSISRRTVLKSAMNYYIKRNLNFTPFLTVDLFRSLVDTIEFPSRPRRVQVRIPNDDQLATFITCANSQEVPDQFMIAMMMTVGLRIDEALSLSKDQIKHARKSGHLIFIRKGGYEADLPIAGLGLSEVFGAVLGSRRALDWAQVWEAVSPGAKHDSARRHVARVVETCGETAMFRAHPHLLRHICASRMVDAGADIMYISQWLGHASIRTTELYVHPALKKAATYLTPWAPDAEPVPEEQAREATVADTFVHTPDDVPGGMYTEQQVTVTDHDPEGTGIVRVPGKAPRKRNPRPRKGARLIKLPKKNEL